MTNHQQKVLRGIIEKYFSGGNDQGNASGKTLEQKLKTIRDFVENNFE